MKTNNLQRQLRPNVKGQINRKKGIRHGTGIILALFYWTAAGTEVSPIVQDLEGASGRTAAQVWFSRSPSLHTVTAPGAQIRCLLEPKPATNPSHR